MKQMVSWEISVNCMIVFPCVTSALKVAHQQHFLVGGGGGGIVWSIGQDGIPGILSFLN